MTNQDYTTTGETWHDQAPSHAPTTRKQELYAAAVELDRRRCVVIDTDADLGAEMWAAYLYVTDYAGRLCEHSREFITPRGQGVDLVILHVCQDCDRVLAVE